MGSPYGSFQFTEPTTSTIQSNNINLNLFVIKKQKKSKRFRKITRCGGGACTTGEAEVEGSSLSFPSRVQSTRRMSEEDDTSLKSQSSYPWDFFFKGSYIDAGKSFGRKKSNLQSDHLNHSEIASSLFGLIRGEWVTGGAAEIPSPPVKKKKNHLPHVAPPSVSHC